MESRRKRLLFRAQHMGTAENDSMFGRFAQAHIEDFTAEQVEQFERLIERNDPQLHAWATGAQAVPSGPEYDVLRMLRAFLTQS